MAIDTQRLKIMIRDFWDWFATHEEKFRIIRNPEAVREMLDNQVLQFGAFSWEIGEDDNKVHTFTISPNGNAQKLRLSEAIIGEAPRLPQWEFYFARPAKKWDFTFEIYDDFMVRRTVDASEWQYLLRVSPDRKLRIFFFANNMHFLDEEDQMSAAQLVLNNCVGEADKIYFVESIVFVPVLEDYQQAEFKALEALAEEFESIVADWL